MDAILGLDSSSQMRVKEKHKCVRSFNIRDCSGAGGVIMHKIKQLHVTR